MIELTEGVRLKKGDTVYVPLILKFDETDNTTSLAHWPDEPWTTVAVRRSMIVGYKPALVPGDRVYSRDHDVVGVVRAVFHGHIWLEVADEMVTVKINDLERSTSNPATEPATPIDAEAV